jgi:hypothetical protein
MHFLDYLTRSKVALWQRESTGRRLECVAKLRYLRPMVTTVCRNPQAPSSALAALGTPQPKAFKVSTDSSLTVTLVSVSNYYVEAPGFSSRKYGICFFNAGSYRNW